MKNIIFISLIFILSACNQIFDPRTISGVDPTFTPYLDLYKSIKGDELYYDIPIQFSNLGESTIGLCTRWSSGHRQIMIDETYWYDPYTTENERISLLFHELGHCDLNRNHLLSMRPNNWPVSLMYPYNYGYVSADESYYFNELFNPVSSRSTNISGSYNSNCVHDIDVAE